MAIMGATPTKVKIKKMPSTSNNWMTIDPTAGPAIKPNAIDPVYIPRDLALAPLLERRVAALKPSVIIIPKLIPCRNRTSINCWGFCAIR